MKWSTMDGATTADVTRHEGTIEQFRGLIRTPAGTTKNGPAVCSCVFTDDRRKKSNVEESWAIMLDFDGQRPDGLATLPWQWLAYTTWSHGTEKGECWRVIVPLSEPVSADEYTVIWRWLAEYLPGADTSAQDASRLMYLQRTIGASGEPPTYRQCVSSPLLSRDDYQTAIDEDARQSRRRELRAEERRQRQLYADSGDAWDWVPSALDCISADVSYDDWLSVGMSLRTAESEGLSGAESYWHQWSSRGSDYSEREAAQKWQSVTAGEVGAGTLWHMATREGWTPPARKLATIDTDSILDRWTAPTVDEGTDTDGTDEAPVGGSRSAGVVLNDTTDLGLADRALIELGWRRGELIWSGTTWWQYARRRGVFVPVSDCVYMHASRNFHGAATTQVDDDGQAKKYVTSHSGRTRIEETARKISTAGIDADTYWQHTRPGVGFRNGFWSYDSGQLEPHSPHNRLTSALDIEHDEGATCPTWERVLRDYWPDCEDTRALIEEFFGVALLGQSTKLAKALFLLGDGSNGKTTLVDVVRGLMPNESTCSVSPHKLSAHNAEYYIINLRHKLLNIVPDLSRRDLQDMGDFKAVVTGDQVTGRNPHGRPELFRPIAGHVVLTNEMPYVSDTSHGFWRRPIAVRFDRIFGDDDRDISIPERLSQERPGIIMRLLRAGCRALERGRYLEPQASTELRDEWRRESDPAALFVDDCEEQIARLRAHDHRVRSAKLYEEYSDWCARTGRGKLNSTNFGKSISRSYDRGRDMHGKYYVMPPPGGVDDDHPF